MLINSQSLDVDIGREYSGQEHEGDHPKSSLRVQTATECPSCHYQCSHRAGNAQQQDEISVDSVGQNPLVSDGRHKLEDDKEASRKKAGEMEKHGRSVQSETVIVALAGAGSFGGTEALAAKDVVDVDVHEASEGEAHQGTPKDEEKDEIVRFVESNGNVDLADHTCKGVGGWLCLVDHGAGRQPSGRRCCLGL